MEIYLEKHELPNENHYTFTKGISYDERGNQIHFESFDRDYLEGLACLTGNLVKDYCEGYIPSRYSKVFKRTITLSEKQVRGLLHLGFRPYYVVDKEKCFI